MTPAPPPLRQPISGPLSSSPGQRTVRLVLKTVTNCRIVGLSICRVCTNVLIRKAYHVKIGHANDITWTFYLYWSFAEKPFSYTILFQLTSPGKRRRQSESWKYWRLEDVVGLDNHQQNLAEENKRLFELVRFGEVRGFWSVCLF